MIEELTPEIVASSLFLISFIAPTLTLLLSALLLWAYRRAVARAMAASAAFDASKPATTPASGSHQLPAGGGPSSSDLYQAAITGPRRYALRYVVTGLAFAVVFAFASRFVYPIRLDLPGFLVGV
jgi:hypothetical protein